MRIAVMGRSLRGQMSGVVRYTHELVSALGRRCPEDLTVFVTQADDGLDGLPLQRVRAPFKTPTEYHRAVWEQTMVPRDLRRLRPDVFHSPNYIVPLASGTPMVVTVHDTGFLDRRVHRLRSHLYLTVLTTAAVHKAARIICVSTPTYVDFCDRFPRAADRARVVTEGVNPRFRPADAMAIDRVRAAYGLPERYILFVGTFEPRKNLTRLVAAYERTIAATDAPDHLVLAGGAGWKNNDVFARIAASELRERIRVLGYVDDDDLPPLYSGCSLFAYPSVLEGFGLPPVEAMACGVPVVTSATSALPETVGDAACLVDPADDASIADGMSRVLTDDGYAKELVESGCARAADMTWEAVAEKTLAVYEEVV
jgi:glycosyltransferase involved in cell wall biosynthesis